MDNLSKIFAAGLLTVASVSAYALPTGSGSVTFNSIPSLDFTHTRIGTDYDEGTFDFVEADNGEVIGTSGSFSAVFADSSPVQFFDFGYGDSFVSPTKIWESNGISFTLDVIYSATDLLNPIFGAGTSDTVVIVGTGTMEDIEGPGLGDKITSGITLTFNSLGGVTWQSTTSVPEPAPLALLGAGLIGIALARRKQKA